MADDKLTTIHVLTNWSIQPGNQPGTVILVLRHATVADMQNGWPAGCEKTTAIVLDDEMRRSLSDDISGRTAAAPRPLKYDS